MEKQQASYFFSIHQRRSTLFEPNSTDLFLVIIVAFDIRCSNFAFLDFLAGFFFVRNILWLSSKFPFSEYYVTFRDNPYILTLTSAAI